MPEPDATLDVKAADAGLSKAFARIDVDIGSAKVVEVGAGRSNSWAPLLAMGFRAENIVYANIRPDRIHDSSGLRLRVWDMRVMPGADRTFDIVFASELFGQIIDPELAIAIGRKMRRLVKPGGCIVVRDWATAAPGDTSFGYVTAARMQAVFGLPVLAMENGALVPRLGRFLSDYMPWAYFPVLRTLPFLTGMKIYVISPRSGRCALYP